jgi:xylulokinase
MSVVLACALGSTSFRAALVDADGVSRAESVVPAPTAIDTAETSEIDAADAVERMR